MKQKKKFYLSVNFWFALIGLVLMVSAKFNSHNLLPRAESINFPIGEFNGSISRTPEIEINDPDYFEVEWSDGLIEGRKEDSAWIRFSNTSLDSGCMPYIMVAWPKDGDGKTWQYAVRHFKPDAKSYLEIIQTDTSLVVLAHNSRAFIPLGFGMPLFIVGSVLLVFNKKRISWKREDEFSFDD